MSTENTPLNAPDPLNEMRVIRSAIVAETGNDVDRFCDALVQVAAEYRTRSGQFAGAPPRTAETVAADWGDSALDSSDPLIDEIREIRRNLAKR